jgi:hypothetical protein
MHAASLPSPKCALRSYGFLLLSEDNNTCELVFFVQEAAAAVSSLLRRQGLSVLGRSRGARNPVGRGSQLVMRRGPLLSTG